MATDHIDSMIRHQYQSERLGHLAFFLLDTIAEKYQKSAIANQKKYSLDPATAETQVKLRMAKVCVFQSWSN